MKKGAFLGVLIMALLAMPLNVKARTEYSEAELLERVVEAEAGNQGMTGKRLVVAVIYNRVESDKFPNTIKEVLESPHQFGPVWTGAVDKVEVTDETRLAIQLEIDKRTDSEILYFNNGPCSGKFAFKYKGHNFGK